MLQLVILQYTIQIPPDISADFFLIIPRLFVYVGNPNPAHHDIMTNDLGYKFKNKIYNRRDFIFLQVRSAKAKKAQLNQPVRTKSLLNAAQCTRLCL